MCSVITLTKPPPVNNMYAVTSRGGYVRIYKKPEAKEWIRENVYRVRSQWDKKTPITENVSLYIKSYMSEAGDIDNILKAILDVLQTARVYENDKQVTFLQVEKIRVSKKDEEKVEIEIQY